MGVPSFVVAMMLAAKNEGFQDTSGLLRQSPAGHCCWFWLWFRYGSKKKGENTLVRGAIACRMNRCPEKAGVGGSTPSLATMF